jgi:hypothetical protein
MVTFAMESSIGFQFILIHNREECSRLVVRVHVDCDDLLECEYIADALGKATNSKALSFSGVEYLSQPVFSGSLDLI